MRKSLRIYLQILSVFYGLGALLHLLDLFDLRLNFSQMDSMWKMWIVFLLIADTVTCIGLWKQRAWGVVAFLWVAVSQLVAYTVWAERFGDQTPLILFHAITLVIFFALRMLPPPGPS